MKIVSRFVSRFRENDISIETSRLEPRRIIFQLIHIKS